MENMPSKTALLLYSSAEISLRFQDSDYLQKFAT